MAMAENLLNLFKRGKDVLSQEVVKAHFPPNWGLLLKERICSLVRGYGKLYTLREKSGKSQGILRWTISGNPGCSKM